MSLNDSLAALGVDIVHHFVGGLYCKVSRIPAGVVLTQHVHPFDHLSVLAQGTVEVTVDGVTTQHHGPEFLTIKAGSAHKVTAITDTVWGCLHATDCTDPDKIDEVLT